MKKIILIFISILIISGCGTVRFGTYIGNRIMPSYVISSERIKSMAPQFKQSWGYISGFITGNPYYSLFAPSIVKDLMTDLGGLHIKAINGTWTEKEQGEMAIKVLQLEFEAGKFIREEYGDEIMTLIRSVLGV